MATDDNVTRLLVVRRLLARVPDEQIAGEVTGSDRSRPEAEYLVATTKQELERIKQEARQALRSGQSAFAIARQLTESAQLPQDVSDTIVSGESTDSFLTRADASLTRSRRSLEDLLHKARQSIGTHPAVAAPRGGDGADGGETPVIGSERPMGGRSPGSAGTWVVVALRSLAWILVFLVVVPVWLAVVGVLWLTHLR